MWELGRLLGDKSCSWLFLSQSWVIFIIFCLVTHWFSIVLLKEVVI